MRGKRGGAYICNLQFAISRLHVAIASRMRMSKLARIDDLRRSRPTRSSRRADAFQVFDPARQAGMLLIAEVQLIPTNAVAVDAPGERQPKVADRERLNQRAGPEVEFSDDVVAVLPLGAELLDPANDTSIPGPHPSAKQQLHSTFSLFFRHDDPLECSRSPVPAASLPRRARASASTICRHARRFRRARSARTRCVLDGPGDPARTSSAATRPSCRDGGGSAATPSPD